MAIKYTLLGALIYGTMLAYLVAMLLRILGKRRWAWAVYAVGFAISVACLIHQGFRAGHLPLSDLFEVCLFMGMAVLPLSLLCRRMGVGIETGDMLLGVIVLFPAAFVFDADAKSLMPALQSNLFLPHVAAYMLSYVILAKAAIQAGAQLILDDRPLEDSHVSLERATYRTVALGFPLLTVGLILGAWWGKRAWGDWWNWDPKEMWGLARRPRPARHHADHHHAALGESLATLQGNAQLRVTARDQGVEAPNTLYLIRGIRGIRGLYLRRSFSRRWRRMRRMGTSAKGRRSRRRLSRNRW